MRNRERSPSGVSNLCCHFRTYRCRSDSPRRARTADSIGAVRHGSVAPLSTDESRRPIRCVESPFYPRARPNRLWRDISMDADRRRRFPSRVVDPANQCHTLPSQSDDAARSDPSPFPTSADAPGTHVWAVDSRLWRALVYRRVASRTTSPASSRSRASIRTRTTRTKIGEIRIRMITDIVRIIPRGLVCA